MTDDKRSSNATATPAPKDVCGCGHTADDHVDWVGECGLCICDGFVSKERIEKAMANPFEDEERDPVNGQLVSASAGSAPCPSDASIIDRPCIDRSASTEAEMQAAIRRAVESGNGLDIYDGLTMKMQIASRRPVEDYDTRTDYPRATELPPVVVAVIEAAERLAEEVWSDNRTDEEQEAICKAVQALHDAEADACSAKADSK